MINANPCTNFQVCRSFGLAIRTLTNWQTHTETDNSILCTILRVVYNEYVKSSCAPPNQYKTMLCITIVYIGTERHCEPWFAWSLSTTKTLWSTMQVSGAQHSSVVHNVVLYPRSGAQSRSYKPRLTDRLTNGTNSITSTADVGGNNHLSTLAQCKCIIFLHWNHVFLGRIESFWRYLHWPRTTGN